MHSGEGEMSVRVSGMCAPGSRPRHRTVARGGGRAGGAAVSRPQRDGGRASGKAGVGSLAPLAPFGNDRGREEMRRVLQAAGVFFSLSTQVSKPLL